MSLRRDMPEGSAEPCSNGRTCYTPAGQRVVVNRNADLWVVACDDHDPVRHRSLDVALIEAIRGEVEAHRAWDRIPPARWARVITDVMVESWPKQEWGRTLGD
jgi:hypothetical protein